MGLENIRQDMDRRSHYYILVDSLGFGEDKLLEVLLGPIGVRGETENG